MCVCVCITMQLKNYFLCGPETFIEFVIILLLLYVLVFCPLNYVGS